MNKGQWFRREWLIPLVVFFAFILRFFAVGYVNYTGQSEAMSLSAYRLIHEGKFPLYGIANLDIYGHYGPAPYYLFALFALFSTSPFSLVVFTILLSTVTTYVLYRIGNDFWNRSVGFIAALLWAASHFSLVTSRGPQSENFAPLFISLFLYAILALIRGKNPRYYGLLFFSSGMILQLHVTAFPALLLIIPALFFGMPLNQRDRRWLIVGCCILFILFSPYLYYEATTGFAETRLGFDALVRMLKGTTEIRAPQHQQSLLAYVNPWSSDSGVNPFLQDIATMDYFCEAPSQHSRLMVWMEHILRGSSIVAWLFFFPLLPLMLLWLIRRHWCSGSIEVRGLLLVLMLFLCSILFLVVLPWHSPYHFHNLLISTLLFWAVGWGWLLPSLAGRYKQATHLFSMLFVLSLAIVNGASWAAFHISNSQKGCISFFDYNMPTLNVLEDVAESLAEDQRFLQRPDETLTESFSSYDMTRGKISSLNFVVRDAVRRREHAGKSFANLSGSYILIREQSLPFRLAPALSVKRIGSFLLIRDTPLVEQSSLTLAKVVENTLDIESVRRSVKNQLQPWTLGHPWPPLDRDGMRTCFDECPQLGAVHPECQGCLGNSTVYLRAYLNENSTARTALVISEFVAGSSHVIGAVYLNDELLFYNNRFLVTGESQRPQEILMEVTGRLNEIPNILEVLFVSQSGSRWPHMQPDIFTLSGD